ncbi:MAG: S41 family peptidase [Dysgonomonas sp.]
MGKRGNRFNVWLPLWIAFGIAIGILIGNIFANFNSRHSLFNRGNKLEAILEYISDSYVDTVNVQELVERSIPDLVSGLDPHSVYISAKAMEMGDELEDNFSGIGVQFILQKDTIVVVSIIKGGPSEAAGVMAGDRIVYVNDSLFAGEGITNDKVMRNLRGESGTSVKLGLWRPSKQDTLSIKVMRASVPVSSIDAAFMLDNKTGYIKINRFAYTSYSDFISAISRLKSEKCESFIIDLRQNTGGSLNAAIQMVNEFLERDQLIVYTEGRAFPRQEYYADGSGTCKENQLIILIDEGSASASEVFSGAIQDSDRGLIVGRRSFGKGLVQDQRQFKDGSALRLTVARYYTPSGRCIQKAYEKGNSSDYNQDLMRRYMRGEFDSQDSIKMDAFPLFHTLGGRPVYGNDGIMSDVFIPRDTTGMNSYYLKLANAGLIYEYAFGYTDKNREKLNGFKDWKNLLSYLQKQPLLDNLVSMADSKGIRPRPYYIEESRKLIENQLQAYIVRNMLGDEGFYQVLSQEDIVIIRAAELMKKGLAMPDKVKNKTYLNN